MLLPAAAALRQPMRQRRALLQRPQRRPQRPVDFVDLRRQHAVGRVDVPDAAAETQHAALVHFPQRPVARGTGKDRWLAGPILAVDGDRRVGEIRLHGPQQPAVACAPPRCVFFDESPEQQRNVPQRQHVIDQAGVDRVARHARRERLVGILDDGDAAGRLDRRDPGRSVVERSRQHDADHAWAVLPRGGSEQRIDGGTNAILRGGVHRPHAAVEHDQVLVGWSDVDPSVLERLSVGRMRGRQASGRLRISGSRLRPRETCRTTNTEACRSRGRSATTRLIASTPPADAPMTMTSCLAITAHHPGAEVCKPSDIARRTRVCGPRRA